MRAYHVPVWLGNLSRSRATPFITLYTILIFCRGILATVVPLSAIETLGDAQSVSLLYFGASLVGLSGSLAAPTLIHHLHRRWVFSLGGSCLVTAPLLFMLPGEFALILGLSFFFLSAPWIEVNFNLYLMDHLEASDLNRFEPMRMFFSGLSWTLGPWLGVYLRDSIAPWLPFAIASVTALGLLIYFWYLRLSDDPALQALRVAPPSVARNLAHYFAQPALRRAWILSVGRSSFWLMFFVYAPIYVVSVGLSDVIAGAIVSLGSSALFLVPLWGWIGRRHGFRLVLVSGYSLAGFTLLSLIAASGSAWLGVTLLLVAAFAMGIVDGAGNLPFLRSVEASERREMTAVFSTYRDMGQLVPPGAFAMILNFFALPAIFLTMGGVLCGMALYCRRLSRTL